MATKKKTAAAKKTAGADVDVDAVRPTFCHECGSALGGSAAVAALDQSTKFCVYCGFKVDANKVCRTGGCKYEGQIPPGVG